MHVEFEDSSNDERVVAEFLALLQRSSSDDREQILETVQQAAAKLRQCEIELAAVKPTGSIVAYFILKSLSAAYKLDTLYNSDELNSILEDIFTCLLKSSQTVRIKHLKWTVNDFNGCVHYFLRKLSK